MTLLGIDTSGKTASAAVCTESAVLAQTTVYTSLTHSQVILPICRDVVKSAGLELSDMDGIAVSAGPGSYTGLRIGISSVKAICFALNKPCIGISTLESLANNVSLHRGIICAVMAARLELVYCAVAVVCDAADRLSGERFITAPLHLKLQLASSLCSAAFGRKMGTPDELEAAYLQITKAEKDLQG